MADKNVVVKNNTWRERVAIGVSEVMFLIGLVLLLIGVWVWLGLGLALTVCGGVLIGTSILNGLLLEARAAKNVI